MKTAANLSPTCHARSEWLLEGGVWGGGGDEGRAVIVSDKSQYLEMRRWKEVKGGKEERGGGRGWRWMEENNSKAEEEHYLMKLPAWDTFDQLSSGS